MENWRFVEGNEDYMVSDQGRVLSLKCNETRIMKVDVKNRGYGSIKLCTRGLLIRNLVHRLVAKNFLPNPKNLPEVNHLDGNKLNNRVENLEWCDHYDNVQHALLHGLFNSKPKPCGVVGERGEVIRRYPSMSQLCKAEGFSVDKLGTQFRTPEVVKNQYNVVLL
nr:HNH endonuclease [uncultured Bacteroides sp.]